MNQHHAVLSTDFVEKIQDDYNADNKNQVIRHALSRCQASSVCFDSTSTPTIIPHFSIEIKTLPVANQLMSGRCWIFAGLNVLREIIAKKCHLKDFELSQNYISMYDKIEKANFALETIIELAKDDPDERTLSFILSSPVSDGGQWDMFVDLVKKYGLMPKEAFPETFQSEHTRELNVLLNACIRDFAYRAHDLAIAGKMDEVYALKDEKMALIYKMFLNAFGVPAKTFDFQYQDEKGNYHIEKGYTPKSFFEKYIGEEIDCYQSLINSPTKDKPYNKNYTIAHLGNVKEGRGINHLNVTMDRLKEAVIAQLKDGRVVWFGSDVGPYRDRDSYAWDDKAIRWEDMFGICLDFSKEKMLDYHHSAMNHAMVITGVDIVDGKIKKWKIENSWGSQGGLKGYYVMSDTFFDKFVYQAVVDKKYLSEEEKAACLEKPTVLSPWDPMGTLAD